jgi:arginyl-tRNA--protein-N-Asp/Glu arginylyltransferase
MYPPITMINEYFIAGSVRASDMDLLWAQGWRHFGTYFFRYSHAEHDGALCHVMPLRLKPASFTLSRSQRRVLKRNGDVEVVVRDAVIDSTKEALFLRHRHRFKQNVPDSLYDFMSESPATVPCRNQEICVYADGRLLAVSFLDIGEDATSAVYAAFEPAEAQRGLGIFTMLCAIEQSRARGCRYYYPGYAYREPSMYDYKKRFSGLESYDWEAKWSPL